MTTDPEQLQTIADEAYASALTGNQWAAGVEDLARYLNGQTPSPQLSQLLKDTAFKARIQTSWR